MVKANLVRRVLSLWGSWYNDNLYYRYHLAGRPPAQRLALRLLLLPPAAFITAYRRLSGQFELVRVEMSITARCTLRCRDCCNLIPCYEKPSDLDTTRLLQDIDDFLGNVDRVCRFVVMGGEPFLHPGLAAIMIHLIKHPQVDIVHLFINATIMPAGEVLALVGHPKVYLTISKYPRGLSRRDKELQEALKQRGARYIVTENNWRDMGGFDPGLDDSPQELKERFASCSINICHNIIDGAYHLCARSGHGQRLGQFPPDPNDSVPFRGRHDPREFQEGLRRLLARDYISACRQCHGGAGPVVPAAIQMGRPDHCLKSSDQAAE
ncbi:MAG: radical SAM protein [Syntrophomonadaceae bacterium]|nr:radical SAM protein [Syntrophomonadaceae bacterium]